MENGVRKREWVKTAAIILLAVLLVLTFFSKTIMNASLPEVATQQVSSGAINARIRGQGTVEASEVYNVTIKQTRKVSSVLVKTGQEINVGDTLFVLEAEDSDELKQAETAMYRMHAMIIMKRLRFTVSTAPWTLRSSPRRKRRPKRS